MKSRIGIVGGGQLGRMLGMAAKQLGFMVIVLDPTPNSPAGQVVDRQILGRYADPEAILALANEVDFLTYEIEHTKPDALARIAMRIPVNPAPETLRMIQDKFAQKEFLREAGIPVARSRSVVTRDEIAAAITDFGLPLLLKARFDAYDGRGNAVIRSADGIDAAMAKLSGGPLYIEEFVPFTKELAVVAARGMSGEIATYAVVETIQRDNICQMVIAPASIEPGTAARADLLARRALERLSGAGIFGVEMFLTAAGDVLINEIAPRVHNSGHYTIEACMTAQFEQQIRAITGLPLGSTRQWEPAVMINILGDRTGPANVTGLAEALAIPGVGVHIYGKAETKPERKMGHLTAVAETIELARERAEAARARLSI